MFSPKTIATKHLNSLSVPYQSYLNHFETESTRIPSKAHKSHVYNTFQEIFCLIQHLRRRSTEFSNVSCIWFSGVKTCYHTTLSSFKHRNPCSSYEKKETCVFSPKSWNKVIDEYGCFYMNYIVYNSKNTSCACKTTNTVSLK